MASFSRISKRLANRQAMEQRMGEYMLGRDVEGERQDIREGRSQYASDVAEYERASMRARGRKGKRGRCQRVGKNPRHPHINFEHMIFDLL